MKKTALQFFLAIVAAGVSIGALAAGTLPSAPLGARLSSAAVGPTAPSSAQARTNPVAPPNSLAFGKSLNGWMGTYLSQFFSDGAIGEKNVKFLPIGCEDSVCSFDITVKPGTALALPLVAWVGCGTADLLPNEWWGDTNHIYTLTTLDGVPIAQPNAAYYVGPTLFTVPEAFGCGADEFNALYQGIGVVIKPLPPGVHMMVLESVFVDFGITFNNTWRIEVRME